MLAAQLLFLAAPLHAAPHAALFVGNSFTQYNDPFALDQSYAALVGEGLPEWDPLSVERYARGGATLSSHLEAASGDGPLNDLLYGDDPAYSWDHVIAQDQSQIPGFPETHTDWIASRDAAVALAEIVEERGAEFHLFMTWAKREGDPTNPELFPDYLTMQALVAAGYGAYAAAIADAGYTAELVPVGLAWQLVYEDHVAAGEDPLDSGALFHRLYAGDGSHPSRLGTYLAACTFYAAITGNSPVGLTWAPDTTSDVDRDQLQEVAARLILEGGDTGMDTGAAPGTDTGTDTGDPPGGDTGGPPVDDSGSLDDTGRSADPGGPDDTGASDDDDKGGGACGCTTGARSGAWVFVLASFVVAGARRQP